MAEWRNRFAAGTTALAALWLIAAPQSASAQWWEDEEASEEGGFSDLENYEDYGLDNEGAAALALTGTAAAQQNQPPPQQGRQQAQQTSMEYRQVRGSIVDAKCVNLRDTDKQAVLVLLESRSGQRTVADLGTDAPGATDNPRRPQQKRN